MTIDRKYLFPIAWLLYFVILGLVAGTTPITPSEAYYFYHTSDCVTFLMQAGYSLIPSEFGIRVFFLFFGMLSAFLYYKVIDSFVSKREDKLLILWIYLFLPGVVTSSILANSAILVSFLVALFLYMYLEKIQWSILPILILFSLLHWSAPFFYLSLFLYSVMKHEKILMIFTLLAMIFYIFFGMKMPILNDTHNILELLGIYATVFSPLLFIYLIYSLYRILLRGERSILWYISFSALLTSLLLSFQYRIKIIDFSPYIMIAVILMIQSYNESLRVRMRRFQKEYRLLFAIVTITLIFSTLSILLNKPIYRTVGKENYAFFIPVYSPYDRAQELLSHGKTCIDKVSNKYLDQLKFYGINKCF